MEREGAAGFSLDWKAVGIDIVLPGNGLPDIVPKPLLGPGGALHNLERMLQRLYRRYA